MSHPCLSHLRPARLGQLILIGSLLISPQPGYAHTVKVDNEVGALFHLEPDHTPRAQQPAQIWFALTLKGGQSLPLAQCDCRLAIYRQPRTAEAEPVLEPDLSSLDVERYQNVPGAEVIFPEIGAYVLELTGAPQAGATFQPFTLSYPVTVIR